MKKRNILRVSGALVIFTVLGLLSACEIFTPYEPPEGGHIELLDIATDTDGNITIYTVKVIKSSKLPDYYIEWVPTSLTVITNDGKLVTSPSIITSPTTLIFTVPETDSDEFQITLSAGFGTIAIYPSDD